MKKTLTILLVLSLVLASLFAQSIEENAQNANETSQMRIVSLSPNVTEIICALGAGDQLVGRSDFCNWPEYVTELPSVGDISSPNAERILSVDPTIVISSSMIDPEFVYGLEQAGVKAYSFYFEENMDDTYLFIEEVARAIGREEEAKLVIQDMKDRISTVQDKVSSIKEEDRKSCIYLISWGEWGDWAATGETYLDGVIELAGGKNAAHEGLYWSISRELLLSEDPDYIILPYYGYTDNVQSIADFKSTEPYSQLTGQVVTINGDRAERQGVRTVETIEEIAKLLYPELF